MFFYRDAQYHRLGSANIHQIPVNCPFMSKSVMITIVTHIMDDNVSDA
jgi:catalase